MLISVVFIVLLLVASVIGFAYNLFSLFIVFTLRYLVLGIICLSLWVYSVNQLNLILSSQNKTIVHSKDKTDVVTCKRTIHFNSNNSPLDTVYSQVK